MARRARLELPIGQAKLLTAAAQQAIDSGTLTFRSRAALEEARQTIEAGCEEMVDGLMLVLTLPEAHVTRRALESATGDAETLARLLPYPEQREALQRVMERLAEAIEDA